MKINVYAKLKAFQKNFPQLTFQNKGYQYIKKEVIEDHKEQIKEILALIKTQAPFITEFNNFKTYKEDKIGVRCQGRYDQTTGFIGVYYFALKDFKPHKDKRKWTIKRNQKYKKK